MDIFIYEFVFYLFIYLFIFSKTAVLYLLPQGFEILHIYLCLILNCQYFGL
jgi:hypothetical protein